MVASVPRLFPDQTVVCLASGPSLTSKDVDYCRGKAPVVAVNDTHRLAPWADVMYACDWKWWNEYDGVTEFAGLKYTLEKRASEQWPGVQLLGRSGDDGICLDPSELAGGTNSGYQAVNLAVHLGAKRIALLGYDMQAGASGDHFFGTHPPNLKRTLDFAMWRSYFESMVEPLRALRVSVVNCTRDTALTCFPRMALREAL